MPSDDWVCHTAKRQIQEIANLLWRSHSSIIKYSVRPKPLITQEIKNHYHALMVCLAIHSTRQWKGHKHQSLNTIEKSLFC